MSDEMGRAGASGDGSARDQEVGDSAGEQTGGNATGDAVGVGAGMGGFLTYDADGPISTTMDEVGGNPGGTGEPGNLNSSSTGGRGAGQP